MRKITGEWSLKETKNGVVVSFWCDGWGIEGRGGSIADALMSLMKEADVFFGEHPDFFAEWKRT